MKKILFTVSMISICLCGCAKNETAAYGTMEKEFANIPSETAEETKNSSETPSSETNFSSESSFEDTKTPSETTQEIVDLTILDSTMTYAQVYDIMNNPQNYIGKIVKAKGNFAYYQDENTNNEYFAVIIADATACCSQGIEFVLSGKTKYPDDYPEVDSEITVKGTFSSYEEDGLTYYTLTDAEIL